MAERLLMKEFRELSGASWVHVELVRNNIFEWDIGLPVLNKTSMYYGAYLKAHMTFPRDYPYNPPVFRFLFPILHPNIYSAGWVCISILHPPGDDEMSGEDAAERWSPAQCVESILVSILSLLDDAECYSPANVDAALLFRFEKEKYLGIVRGQVKASMGHRPAGFKMPSDEPVAQSNEQPEDLPEEEDFWAASEVDSDVFDDVDQEEEQEESNPTEDR
ncbi:Ubiquitin-conjugating enzyme [Penicillium oxalicum]|uniref:Ubiquitin-conjugating enzyme n=1 Tax=Penicillium oxalicum TaxID=69781 RepID=UPI0020B80540|nr:Ubiquitin-conjugating enzyme [Penicillium oxalicum]KAI2794006.1 Ubiquitin-conjugating enzyme [Penicillium oxalicum]